MLQEIFPHRFENRYKDIKPEKDDFLIVYDNGKIGAKISDDGYAFFTCEEISAENGEFLFSLDGKNVFGAVGDILLPGGEYLAPRQAIAVKPAYIAYGLLAAYHILKWKAETKFCPNCGGLLEQSDHEQAKVCPVCKVVQYPRISPAVIVAVLNGNKILFSKYAGRDYTHYALLAGFAEYGETIEETCRREVFEETGLKIKDLIYYKSQPWALSQSLLFGFYCYLDGDDAVTLDETELSRAEWFDIDNMPISGEDNGSLTREMMLKAKNYIKR